MKEVNLNVFKLLTAATSCSSVANWADTLEGGCSRVDASGTILAGR